MPACLGGSGSGKHGPLQLRQTSPKDGRWHARGERLPAWWQCYTAIQGTRFKAIWIGEMRIKSVPNVRSFFPFAATLMGVVQCKKLGTEFANIYLYFLESGPGLRFYAEMLKMIISSF